MGSAEKSNIAGASNFIMRGSALSEIGQDRIYIIAEIGQNHQGEFAHAKELIEKAKHCGVDAVKSQKRDTRTLLTDEQYNRPYNTPNSFGPTYGLHRDALELSSEQHRELKSYANSLGIDYFVSPWDPVSASQMIDIGMSIFKIASASITDEETVAAVVDSGSPIIMSTGMSSEDEIDRCVTWLRRSSSQKIILHCTSTYPSEFSEINLSYLHKIVDRYPDFTVGFSGHHRGIAIDIAAAAMGARVIERHFTLDRSQKGSDHSASLEPSGLMKMVRDIRAFEQALGDGVKRIYDGELPMREKLRRLQ